MLYLLGASPVIKKVKAKRKQFFICLILQKSIKACHVAMGSKLGICVNMSFVDIAMPLKFIVSWK